MSNTRGDANKSDASPESTWGANQETKEAWDRKHGKAARRAAEEAAKSESEKEKK